MHKIFFPLTLVLALEVGAAAQEDETPFHEQGGNGFTREMSGRLTFAVAMNGPPPSSLAIDQSAYPYFPLTMAWSQQIDRIVATKDSSVACAHWIWVNRSRGGPNQKPNVLYPPIRNADGDECRPEYSTLQKADAATKVQLMYSCGAKEEDCRAVAKQAGFDPSKDIVPWSSLKAAPDAYFTGHPLDKSHYITMLDKIWLPIARIKDAAANPWGIVLDSEMADGRTPEQLLATMLDFIGVIHAAGFKAAIFPDSLNAFGGMSTGFDRKNLPAIQKAADVFCLMAWSKNKEKDVAKALVHQVDLLRGPDGRDTVDFSKIMVTFELGSPGTGLEDARAVRNFIITHKAFGVNFWRNNATQGGPINRLTNQKIAMVCFGSTDGKGP